MLRTWCAAWALAALLVPAALRAEPVVKIEKQENSYLVTIDGEPLATYRTGDDLPKPFFVDVRSAGGAIITRPLGTGEDHPHHKGVWVAIDEVNDIKFWAEKGQIKNVAVDLITPEGNPAQMKVTNHWVGEDGQPVVIETTRISIGANRLFTYEIEFRAGSNPVRFDDTKEGLFGIRLGNTVRESQGGTVVNADGKQGTKEAWGQRSAWVDYYGDLEGQIHGAAIFDDPANPRPSRYHVRNYGLFTISPFGEKSYTNGQEAAQPLELEPGQTFRLRYGLFVHPGTTEQAKVAEVYADWVKRGSSKSPAQKVSE